MKFVPGELPGLVIVEPQVFGDDRGFFMEVWHQQKFASAGLDVPFVQDNHSRSSQGVLRGLHYQLHKPQGKLVRVIRGEVFDVAVDLRTSSSTFGRWSGVTLSEENRRQLFVPPGFAHGFCVTSPAAEVVYKCTDFYERDDEHTLLWNDPQLKIPWPVAQPTLSIKDQQGRSFADAPKFS